MDDGIKDENSDEDVTDHEDLFLFVEALFIVVCLVLFVVVLYKVTLSKNAYSLRYLSFERSELVNSRLISEYHNKLKMLGVRKIRFNTAYSGNELYPGEVEGDLSVDNGIHFDAFRFNDVCLSSDNDCFGAVFVYITETGIELVVDLDSLYCKQEQPVHDCMYGIGVGVIDSAIKQVEKVNGRVDFWSRHVEASSHKQSQSGS